MINTSIKTGLNNAEVLKSREQFGKNILTQNKLNPLHLLIRQFTGNPLVLLLVVVTTISFFLNQRISAIYVFWMIIISTILGFWNEYSAEKTVADLLKKISYKASVIRNGIHEEINASDLVVGDVVFVGPGNVVPADFNIVESKDLELNEASLTGESNPVYKTDSECFMGTVVLSGWGRGVVTEVGDKTSFGKIARDVSFIKPETDFQVGLRRFSKLMINSIMVLTLLILVMNIVLGKGVITALMFSLAIAVGLTPELLPIIVTISLSHGAGKLSKKGVLAKQLISLENLGNMDVLCTDKTGTLTEGKISLTQLVLLDQGYHDISLLEYSLICNSAIVEKKILGNPMDAAIWAYAQAKNFTIDENWKKIFEIPFNYENKAALAVAQKGSEALLIAKGAPEQIIATCSDVGKAGYLDNYYKWASEGYRVIAVAVKNVDIKNAYSWDDVVDMHMLGLLVFFDTPKKSAKFALDNLKKLNVSVKILTGDSHIVSKKIASEVGLDSENILLGEAMDKMTDDQLIAVVNKITIFARVSPEQKMRVIGCLKQNGHTVGYLGDGVNDIPSLHNADVGITVDSGVDVAKDAANMVILKKDLHVIVDGIIEGRRTFNNTVKYILMSASSNFGNMLSASVASAFLPFLPMTPTQILLNNTLYDFSQMSIPSDNVDLESLVKPRHWDIRFIKNYMLFFGPISSLYDFLTYFIMFKFFHAHAALFQTGWFVESLATQVLVVFVIRTSKSPFYKSRPGKYLTATTLLITALGCIIPFTMFGHYAGFVSLPANYFAILALLVGSYLALVEFSKRIFLRYHPL